MYIIAGRSEAARLTKAPDSSSVIAQDNTPPSEHNTLVGRIYCDHQPVFTTVVRYLCGLRGERKITMNPSRGFTECETHHKQDAVTMYIRVETTITVGSKPVAVGDAMGAKKFVGSSETKDAKGLRCPLVGCARS